MASSNSICNKHLAVSFKRTPSDGLRPWITITITIKNRKMATGPGKTDVWGEPETGVVRTDRNVCSTESPELKPARAKWNGFSKPFIGENIACKLQRFFTGSDATWRYPQTGHGFGENGCSGRTRNGGGPNRQECLFCAALSKFKPEGRSRTAVPDRAGEIRSDPAAFLTVSIVASVCGPEEARCPGEREDEEEPVMWKIRTDRNVRCYAAALE